MEQIEKKQRFKVGDTVTIKDVKSNDHVITEITYIYFSGGEGWQYVIKDAVTGEKRIVIGEEKLSFAPKFDNAKSPSKKK